MIGVNIVSVIILLGILIFVHELGHFLVAKFSGVGVLKFSLGFGPKLIGKKIGETEYLLSMVPLGGYVKLLGESEEDTLSPEDEKRSFTNQPVFKKIGIVAAGPFFNFLFAAIVFSIIYMTGVPNLTSEIGDVQENSAAYKAGIQKGDFLSAIDGQRVNFWSDVADIVAQSNGRNLVIAVERNNQIFNLDVMPDLVDAKNIFGEKIAVYRIGISASSNTVIERQNPFNAVIEGVCQTWMWTKLTYLSIVKIIQGVVSPKTLGGPILIAQMAGAQVKKGITPFIFFMSVLSINLGVLNLLPIPVLDGGHLFFYIIEAITGKEVNIKWRELAQQIGFLLLILLMIFVFYNDIVRILSD